MPQIRVLVDKETGAVQLFTRDLDGDLTFVEGSALTDGLREQLAALLGPGGIASTSAIEQHRPDGGAKHAHIVSRVGQGR